MAPAGGQAAIPSKPSTFNARWERADVEQIRQRAEDSGLNMTEYVRRCALGLNMDDSALQRHVDDLERRLSLLEEKTEAATW